jgi:hypothetical protein
MARKVHSKETDEHQTVVGQEWPLVEEPLAFASGAIESKQEATPSGVPSAAPPTPPSGRLAAIIQRMPPVGRWTLGLSLAFLSSFAFVLLSHINPAATVIAFVVTFGLALAAGFVLSSWWALLALAVATATGGLVGSWVVVQMMLVGAGEGPRGMAAVLLVFAFFAVLNLGPLIVLLLAGVGLGKQQGIALGQPQALSVGEARMSLWIASLGPVIAGGFLTQPLGNMPGMLGMQAMQGDVLGILPGILYAIVLAATCLLAGWLLRSWWGFVVAPIVYAGVAALVSQSIGGASDWPIWTVGFVLYIVLPAVVMSAIGTAIGMYRDQ